MRKLGVQRQLSDGRQTFAAAIRYGWNGPGRLRWSMSASGRVASVLSFDRLTETRPDFADSSHRRPLANARHFDLPDLLR